MCHRTWNLPAYQREERGKCGSFSLLPSLSSLHTGFDFSIFLDAMHGTMHLRAFCYCVNQVSSLFMLYVVGTNHKWKNTLLLNPWVNYRHTHTHDLCNWEKSECGLWHLKSLLTVGGRHGNKVRFPAKSVALHVEAAPLTAILRASLFWLVPVIRVCSRKSSSFIFIPI